MPGVRGVLFDFAGTLFMPRPAREMVAAAGAEDAGAWAAAYEQAGLPGGRYPEAVPPELQHLYAIRDSGPEAHQRAYVALLRAAGEPSPGFADRVYAQIRSPEGWVPYADAHEVVCALLVAGLELGVVSNVGFDLRPILRAHGFEALADRCALSFEVGATKPDPAIFAAARDLVGTPAEETLMVGDHPEADGGAAVLGMSTLLLPMTPPGSRHGLEAVLQLVRDAALPRNEHQGDCDLGRQQDEKLGVRAPVDPPADEASGGPEPQQRAEDE